MKKLLALLAVVACSPSFAEPTTLRIPDAGWEIRFDAPATTRTAEDSTPARYHYAGNAGRFDLSLYLEEPTCPGGATLEDHVRCFSSRIDKVPNLVKQSIRANAIPRGFQVSYLVYAPVDGAMVKMLHTHLLFADQGKWGDLHASVIKPTPEEIAMLLGLGDKFAYVANRP
jgi:hypothetical protein